MSDQTPQPIPVECLESTATARVEGTATFEARGIDVRLADGRRLELPYRGLVADRGGAADGTLIVTVPTGETTYVRLFFERGGVGSKLGDRLPEDVSQQIRKLVRTSALRRHPVLWAGGCLALVGAIAWFGTFGALDLVVNATPTAWEIKFGEAVASSQHAQRCEDPVVTKAVGAITDRLVDQLPKGQPYPFHFTVVWDDEKNAFALPGGQVMVTSGLIAASDSPDEVAGVLGHEIQHVMGRHTFRRMAKGVGLGLLVSAVLGDASGTAAVAIGQQLVGLKFDRDQESEADRVGVRLAYDAGFRPDALGDFFKRLQKEETLDEATARTAALLSTHPAHGDRLAEIARLAGELPRRAIHKDALAAQWAEVRAHAGHRPEAAKKVPAEPSDD